MMKAVVVKFDIFNLYTYKLKIMVIKLVAEAHETWWEV